MSFTFNGSPNLFESSNFLWIVSGEQLLEHAIKRPLNFKLTLGREKNEILMITKQENDAKIQVILHAAHIKDIEGVVSDVIIRHLIGNPPRNNVLLLPAERAGLHLFYRELSNRRVALLHHATKKDKDINIRELIHDFMTSRYARPIAEYIDWLNELPNIRKMPKGDFHDIAKEIQQIVGGRYDVDAEGDISFTPYKKQRGEKHHSPKKMDFHLTSSIVKSLFGLWAYLEYEAKPGDVLMIDEPELNLHPINQRKLAKILARLVNHDLRVIVSTHSDYFVREINSLIMLSKATSDSEKAVQKRLMGDFNYAKEDIVNPDKVSAWLFEGGKIQAMDVNHEEGINAKTFDDQIVEINNTSDEIYYAYKELSESDVEN